MSPAEFDAQLVLMERAFASWAWLHRRLAAPGERQGWQWRVYGLSVHLAVLEFRLRRRIEAWSTLARALASVRLFGRPGGLQGGVWGGKPHESEAQRAEAETARGPALEAGSVRPSRHQRSGCLVHLASSTRAQVLDPLPPPLSRPQSGIRAPGAWRTLWAFRRPSHKPAGRWPR